MKTYYGVALIKADEEAPDSDIKIPCLVSDSEEDALAFKKYMESKFPVAEYSLAIVTF